MSACLTRNITLIILIIVMMTIVVSLTSCTVKPFTVTSAATATAPARVVRSLGGSILTKAGQETASMTLPDGTQMSYSVKKKTEVSVPNAYIAGQVIEGVADIAAGVSNTSTAAEVSKAGIAADVSKTQIEATKAVDLLKAAPTE